MRSDKRRSARENRGDEEGGESGSERDDLSPWRLGELAEDVRRRTEESPVKTIALALGVGYLIGGGLFSPLTARIVGTGLRLGMRVALLPFVTQSLLSLAEGVVSSNPNIDDVGRESGGNAGGVAEGRAANHSRSGSPNQVRQPEIKETHS